MDVHSHSSPNIGGPIKYMTSPFVFSSSYFSPAIIFPPFFQVRLPKLPAFASPLIKSLFLALALLLSAFSLPFLPSSLHAWGAQSCEGI